MPLVSKQTQLHILGHFESEITSLSLSLSLPRHYRIPLSLSLSLSPSLPRHYRIPLLLSALSIFMAMTTFRRGPVSLAPLKAITESSLSFVLMVEGRFCIGDSSFLSG
ncbi:hypothetical protein RchiOBHm_Chr4g0408351 [Rosa chinensis]|uniref:Uncharacterized protein n=1 Tax=Rosa chinensis TaxID=74649 RepID=A0A2P6QUU2_ROSCH|nr:hypothetical protein RchiOBHm_Chr4g0408351 [Rosa chinensis]